MTEIESLRAQHADLGRRIEALERGRGGEWPQVGDTFFYILAGGSIYSECWDDCPYHHEYRDIGNCYRTEAEARRGHLAATAMRLLRQWADEDMAANPDARSLCRCVAHTRDNLLTGVSPYFVSQAARDRAQAALSKEQLEALA